MLIQDTETLAKAREIVFAEEERHKTLNWLKEQMASSVYVRESGNDRTNWERQFGHALPVQEVERRLALLNSRLRFEHTVNPHKKYLKLAQPDGSLETLMVYESGLNGPIPERSIMNSVIKEELNPDVVRGRFHIDRKDLPKHEVRPHEFDSQGRLTREGDVQWDPTVPILGMQREKREWSEAVRGYRTICLWLVHMGLTTPDAVERVFGGDNRPEWAFAMGKREKKETPW